MTILSSMKNLILFPSETHHHSTSFQSLNLVAIHYFNEKLRFSKNASMTKALDKPCMLIQV